MKLNQSALLILKTYLLTLSIFTIFRVILFLTQLDRVNFEETAFITIIKAFIMGIRFDVVISGYILFLPAFILFTLETCRLKSIIIRKIVFFWIFILFSVSFIITAADVPYFIQFYDRFTIGAFEWIDNLDFVLAMIIQEPQYFLFTLPFFALDIVFYIILKRLFKKTANAPRINVFANILLSLVLLAVMFVGIRGRIEKKSPIRVGTAYFSDNSFLNKLGLNPVFTLIHSYIQSTDSRYKTIHLMDGAEATAHVQSYLNLEHAVEGSPIARKVVPDTVLETKPNVIFIIMESMSTAKMEHFGNSKNLTPFLDSLADNSLFFENIYTAGKHTFNGIFSTLYSFPAIYRQHPLKYIKPYDGISSTLQKMGYTTTYFTTHDSQFDNVGGFLRANGFQNVISQTDYPAEEVKTTLGVPDDYMFRHAIPIINTLSEKKRPFFVTFMTTSDHGPFYIPDYFKPHSKEIKQQIVEYADWSLKQFITMCSKEDWFDNTLFVFVADHGAPLDASYEIALNYFHSPLLFYGPKILPSPENFSQIGGQIDIFPTVMGLIKQTYVNNTLGIDLLNETRPYTLINDDDKIGILDTAYFCIMKRNDPNLQLYKYRARDLTNYADQDSERAEEMSKFAKSNLQLFQNMIKSGETTRTGHAKK